MLQPSDNGLSVEQTEVLNDFINQFRALQESFPAQLEVFSNNFSLVEKNMHDKLMQEIHHVLS